MLPYSPYLAHTAVDHELIELRSIAAQQRRVRAAAEAAALLEPRLGRRMRARVDV